MNNTKDDDRVVFRDFHGRWIKRNHAENNPEYLRRIVDLDVVLNGASVYVAENPRWADLPGAGWRAEKREVMA